MNSIFACLKPCIEREQAIACLLHNLNEERIDHTKTREEVGRLREELGKANAAAAKSEPRRRCECEERFPHWKVAEEGRSVRFCNHGEEIAPCRSVTCNFCGVTVSVDAPEEMPTLSEDQARRLDNLFDVAKKKLEAKAASEDAPEECVTAEGPTGTDNPNQDAARYRVLREQNMARLSDLYHWDGNAYRDKSLDVLADALLAAQAKEAAPCPS